MTLSTVYVTLCTPNHIHPSPRKVKNFRDASTLPASLRYSGEAALQLGCGKCGTRLQPALSALTPPHPWCHILCSFLHSSIHSFSRVKPVWKPAPSPWWHITHQVGIKLQPSVDSQGQHGLLDVCISLRAPPSVFVGMEVAITSLEDTKQNLWPYCFYLRHFLGWGNLT